VGGEVERGGHDDSSGVRVRMRVVVMVLGRGDDVHVVWCLVLCACCERLS
jgi:hypothetical protein